MTVGLIRKSLLKRTSQPDTLSRDVASKTGSLLTRKSLNEVNLLWLQLQVDRIEVRLHMFSIAGTDHRVTSKSRHTACE